MTALTAALLAITAPAAPPAETPEIVLLDFTAGYCGPCQTIKPQIEALARRGYPIRQVDISERSGYELSRRMNVRLIPTFILMVDGKEKARLQGPDKVAQIKTLMDGARRSSQAGARRREPQKRSLLDRATGGLFTRTPENDEEAETIRAQEPEAPQVEQTKSAPKATSADARAKIAALASVRIRVSYDNKVQFGSGTVIQHRGGTAIILTCAHIMDQAKNPKVEVDVFSGDRTRKPRTVIGKVIGHHIKSDVGLISVKTKMRLSVAEVLPPGLKPKKGDRVYSYGCNNGKLPTLQQAKISAVNPYTGPNNLQTDRAPENGRSGGGLFTAAGQVVGVCSAADNKRNHGLYAGNQAIYEMLRKHKLLSVYGKEIATGPSPKKRTTLNDVRPDAPLFDDGANSVAAAAPVADPGAGLSDFNAVDTGIPEKIHTIPGRDAASQIERTISGMGGDAEVTVVIRPRDPRKSSEIVVIPHASSNFITMLQGEIDDQPQHTSFEPPASGRLTRRGMTRPLAVRQLVSDATRFLRTRKPPTEGFEMPVHRPTRYQRRR